MSDPPAIHWYSKVALVSPSSSSMAEVSAVSVSPTWGVPLMAGRPVASEFGLGATATVAALVRDSWLSASSVKLTFTWIVCPWSLDVSR